MYTGHSLAQFLFFILSIVKPRRHGSELLTSSAWLMLRHGQSADKAVRLVAPVSRPLLGSNPLNATATKERESETKQKLGKSMSAQPVQCM